MTNARLAERLDCDPKWIREVTGIEERRLAGPARDSRQHGRRSRPAVSGARRGRGQEVGMLLAASGSAERGNSPDPPAKSRSLWVSERRPPSICPSPARAACSACRWPAGLHPRYGAVLVVAAEKMSAIALREPLDRNVSILFGDGAGACLIGPIGGRLRVIDSVLHSDGAFAADLQLEPAGRLEMNGRSVIMQASRKIPGCIAEVLGRNGVKAAQVEAFLMHQANQNLIDRVARLELDAARFSNIRRYGNTSSASMLIARRVVVDGPTAGA